MNNSNAPHLGYVVSTIFVRVEKPYGVVTYYPECEASRALVVWLGQKTFTQSDIEQLKGLGYTVKTKETVL